MLNFEKALQEFLKGFSDQEIKDYFETFLIPLNRELDNEASNVPAKTLRIKRQQTQHIKNCLLTLRGK